jgi:DNA-binding transcriptional LysR family regulator
MLHQSKRSSGNRRLGCSPRQPRGIMRHLPELELVQSFLAVAEELSFRRAAERLSLDQSALSRRIKELESKLGFPLLFRTTRTVRLTEAGRQFYEDNTGIVSLVAGSVERARRISEGKTGRLRIGYMAFATTEKMPQAVKAFGQRFPDINVEIKYLRTEAQKIALAQGAIDIGFLIGPWRHSEFATYRVSNERLLAVLPANHRLAKKTEILLSDLAQCELVLGDMEQWDSYRAIVERIFTLRALKPKLAYEASNTLAIIGLVAAGLGVTLYPEGIRRLAHKSLAIRKIEDCDTHVETVVAWQRSAHKNRVRHFVEVCRSLNNRNKL